MPLIEALKFASATAAINITALGARGHLATPSEVNLFFHNTTKIRYIHKGKYHENKTCRYFSGITAVMHNSAGKQFSSLCW
ncbi:hypothetical protein SE956_10405 [Escherichia coli]|nr:hypothetical protein [Escherichia coli]